MSWIQIILAIVSAAPQIIAAVKFLWDMISKLINKKQRLAFRKELRNALLASVSKEHKTLDEVSFMSQLDALKERVQAALDAQHAEHVAGEK